MKPTIDPTLERVCLPLSQDEFDLLEKQIIRDGCLDPLKVWDHEGTEILLDGHNRLKICEKHKLPYRKAGRRPLPFKGGDECRTVSSLPITIYPLGYI